jgi:hypothetical protein
MNTDDVIDVLRRAKSLIDKPEKWAKGKGGHFPDEGTCIVGALYGAIASEGCGTRVYLNDAMKWPGFAGAYDALKDIVGCPPATWQDRPERTHAEVMDLIDWAIASVRSGGAAVSRTQND